MVFCLMLQDVFSEGFGCKIFFHSFLFFVSANGESCGWRQQSNFQVRDSQFVSENSAWSCYSHITLYFFKYFNLFLRNLVLRSSFETRHITRYCLFKKFRHARVSLIV